jgi:hypothetical protein
LRAAAIAKNTSHSFRSAKRYSSSPSMYSLARVARALPREARLELAQAPSTLSAVVEVRAQQESTRGKQRLTGKRRLRGAGASPRSRAVDPRRGLRRAGAQAGRGASPARGAACEPAASVLPEERRASRRRKR